MLTQYSFISRSWTIIHISRRTKGAVSSTENAFCSCTLHMLHWKTAHISNTFTSIPCLELYRLEPSQPIQLEKSGKLILCKGVTNPFSHRKSDSWQLDTKDGHLLAVNTQQVEKRGFPQSYSISSRVHTVYWRPCINCGFQTCCLQQGMLCAAVCWHPLRNSCGFCCYPQDVNVSINLQRAATFGWHLT